MIPKQTRSRERANKESGNLWSRSATGNVGISHQSKEGPERWLDRCVHLRQDDTGGCSTWLISNNFVSLFGEWILIKRKKMRCNPQRCCGWNWYFHCVVFLLLYLCPAVKADSHSYLIPDGKQKNVRLYARKVPISTLLLYYWVEWRSYLELLSNFFPKSSNGR